MPLDQILAEMRLKLVGLVSSLEIENFALSERLRAAEDAYKGAFATCVELIHENRKLRGTE